MKVLVCLDGEPHTRGAIEHAISLGLSERAEVIGLHVVDPWLRQFYSEIYAQGRKEYLEWVDACLKTEALQAGEEFSALCSAQGVDADFKIRHGEPLTQILEEIEELFPELVITGAKALTAWGRFRSANVPLRLKRKLSGTTPIISIEPAVERTDVLPLSRPVERGVGPQTQ